MRTKPVGATAGLLVTGVMLSGCSFSRNYHDGGAPPPAPASLSYSQVPGWTAQPARAQATSGYQPVAKQTSANAKNDGGPMEIATSLQLVNGTTGSPTPTPMLTITLPAVKFLVPVTGAYSFGQQNGETVPATATDPSSANATMPSTPATAPSTIQYLVPTTTGVQAAVQNTPAPPAASPPQHLPAFTPPENSSAPKAEEAKAPTTKQTTAVPLPNWPAEAPAADDANPPPPPAINRPTQGLPGGQ